MEIKFRVWDTLQHKLLVPDYIEFLNEEPYWVDVSDGDDGFQDDGDPQSMRLEQYTGLKDSHGKDIYVGDVVQPIRVTENWPGLNNLISKVGKPFLVKSGNHVHGKWIARSVADKGFGVDDWNIGPELMIIGNIHENPELLEVEHD